MIKFNSLAELRSERIRLYKKKELLEEEMKLDFEELKESLKPLNMIKDFFTRDRNSHDDGQPVSPAVATVGSTLIDLLVSRFVFNKNSYIKKLISSYLIHTTGPAVIEKYAPTLVNKFKIWLGNMLAKNNSKPIYEQSTSHGWYEE
jgi:hypothetical protein